MPYCPKCGKPAPPKSAYCPVCGTNIPHDVYEEESCTAISVRIAAAANGARAATAAHDRTLWRAAGTAACSHCRARIPLPARKSRLSPHILLRHK